jgi:hypothetical protein
VLQTVWLARREGKGVGQLAAAGDASYDDGRRLERERLADNAVVGTATTLGEPDAGEGGDDQPDNRDGS